jgi:hypothetical protein
MAITTSFKTTGLTVAKVANSATSGTLIAAPGSGHQIVVFDVVTAGALDLTDGSSDIIQMAGAGGYHFTAGVPFGDNKVVAMDASVKTTVTYTIVRSS